MYQVIIIIHVLAGLGVIGLVLMQQGRGADAGAAFGSGSSGSVFGAQGSASFLSRATSIFAVIFFSTSLGLAVLGGQLTGNKDLMDAPDVEQAIPDLPVIFDDEPMRVPSISDQQEDLPITFDDAESSDNKPLDQTNTGESTEQVFDFESIVPDNLESEK